MTLDIILFLFLALLAGVGIGLLPGRARLKAAENEKTRLETELAATMATLEQQRERLAEAGQRHEREMAERREEFEKTLAGQMELMQRELRALTVEQLAAKQAALQQAGRAEMDALLAPIKEQFGEFKRSVEESRTQSEVNKQQLQSAFEKTLGLFRQEQQLTVASLKEQTQRIAGDAANLTKALKGDSKLQGDWGEMVLETILENSGLERDREFFVQQCVRDESGRVLRPDVVVRFPEGRSVVIDSKVSLTAYASAVETEDEAERERHLREHARSVRKHVDELAAKDYSAMVDDAIGFVLMFVPNENSYITAMKQQPDLSRYAYQKHVIIISPSNLLMTLHLAYNLWQYDKQNRNVEKIVKSAADLYDKVAGFSETFAEVEGLITRLQGSFTKAKGQLYDGRGSVMTRTESLKLMGVTPKKQIRQNEEE